MAEGILIDSLGWREVVLASGASEVYAVHR